MIQFQGFAPDLPNTTEGIMSDCSNLIPTTKGFKAAKTLVPSGLPQLIGDVKGEALEALTDKVAGVVVRSIVYQRVYSQYLTILLTSTTIS